MIPQLLFAALLAPAALGLTGAQTLTASSYPGSAPQPAAFELQANGATGPACTAPRLADGSVRPDCPLDTLKPGVYTLALRAKDAAGVPSPWSIGYRLEVSTPQCTPDSTGRVLRCAQVYTSLDAPVSQGAYAVSSTAAYPVDAAGKRSITRWPQPAVLGEACDCARWSSAPFCAVPRLSTPSQIVAAGCTRKP